MTEGFRVLARDGLARSAVLTTSHGQIETPAFMPVGTLGSVKGLSVDALRRAGAQVMLSNYYHLSLRPGVEALERLGGVHGFTGWSGPILTDSGGYQVFSLATLRTVDDEGVTFRNHLDGSPVRFTPASVAEGQRRFGVDIAMVLDECPPWPVEPEVASASLDRTIAWARASRAAWPGGASRQFGIVQGSSYRELRERSVTATVEIGFDGYAIGGVSVGEPDAERRQVVEWTAPILPDVSPRYLMGVGYPRDILHAVRHGVDLFDCVLPARNGRHAVLFRRGEPLKIKNAKYALDERPIDESCGCETCRTASRAFLHHLYKQEPLSGKVLGTIHNITFYLDFLRDIRQAIAARALDELAARYALDEA